MQNCILKGTNSMATAKKETKPAAKSPAKKEEKAPVKKTVAPAEKVEKKPAPKAKKYHISQSGNMYQVKAEGAEKALKLFRTQAEAIAYAKKVANNQEGYVVVHSLTGKIRKG